MSESLPSTILEQPNGGTAERRNALVGWGSRGGAPPPRGAPPARPRDGGALPDPVGDRLRRLHLLPPGLHPVPEPDRLEHDPPVAGLRRARELRPPGGLPGFLAHAQADGGRLHGGGGG